MIVGLNCDMGEGMGNDELIMPYIQSASIACGQHAGDERTMKETMLLAQKYNVSIGAHISFSDRDNFGRKEMKWQKQEIYDLVMRQLLLLGSIAGAASIKPVHVKPHGALYNMSARDPSLANSIAAAIKDYDENLIVFGLSGSHSIEEAKAIGLKTASETFADRTYRDDGSLTPRSQPGALIQQTGVAVAQVVQMIREGTVTTVSGKRIPILAETICIHGDGQQAVEFAKAIHTAMTM